MSQPFKVCPQCQTPAALTDAVCSNCAHIYRTQFGPQPTQMIQVPRIVGTHSVFAALLFSLLMPGGGQYYNGQQSKSVILVSLCIAFFFGGLAAPFLGSMLHADGFIGSILALSWPVCWLSIPLIWFIQLLDAAFIAGHVQHGEHVQPWDWF